VPWVATAIHAHLLPNGRVLFWSNRADSDPNHGNVGWVYIWSYNSNDATQQPAPILAPPPPARSDPKNNPFCSAHSFLPDGKLLVSGGNNFDQDYKAGNRYTNIFDYRTNSWAQAENMTETRWYPTQTIMKNGETFVLGGETTLGVAQFPDVVSQYAGVWQANDTWRRLLAEEVYYIYPWIYSAGDGRIFLAGPQEATSFIDPLTGQRTGSTIHTNYQASVRDYGSSVLYDNDKILILGGGNLAPSSGSVPTDSAETIDLGATSPSWNDRTSNGVDPMLLNIRRRQTNSTVLPNGKVLVTGGYSGPGFPSDQSAAPPENTWVRAAELWDPVSRSFYLMNSECVYRGYHSTAMLLPDGRVLSAGTTAIDLSRATRNAEIYSPSYLFGADGQPAARPAISGELTDARSTGSSFIVTGPDGPPATVKYGDRIKATLGSATPISKVSLIRLPSVTHSFNQNGRFSTLRFKQSSDQLTVTISAPGNAFYSPPGDYMLFLLNAQGVPALAKIIRMAFIHLPQPPPDPHPLNPLANNNSDEAWFFIQQHYYDFLDREPDQGGWDYWANKIQYCIDNPSGCSCGGVPCDLATRRANISLTFYNSVEFQQTGSFVYRTYKGSLNRIPTFAEFMPDRGKVIGGPNLETSKQTYTRDFVQRADFVSMYPEYFDADTFVNQLLWNIYVTTSGAANLYDRYGEFVGYYNYGDIIGSRAQVVRLAIDDSRFVSAEDSRSFVAMEYYGYLRRNFDQVGFDFWVCKLGTNCSYGSISNCAPCGTSKQDSVKAFIESVEYRKRWGKP